VGAHLKDLHKHTEGPQKVQLLKNNYVLPNAYSVKICWWRVRLAEASLV